MNATTGAGLENIKAVILDWAGTTIDYGSRAPTQVFIEMFRRRGVPITETEARGPMGSAKRDHIAAIVALPRIERAWSELYRRAPGESDIDAIYAEFLPLQKATLSNHCDLIPGLLEAMAELRSRGIKIGSTTGYTRELMEVVVPLAADRGYEADVVICSDDVAKGRPAPWMNFRAAEALGVYPMSQVAIVDDTPVGIEAARNAGAIAVAVSQTGNALGLSMQQIAELIPAELEARLTRIEQSFRDAGAQVVLRSAADLPSLLKARMG